MIGSNGVEIIDVTDAASFELIPPCTDPRFDHRSCDYWEDGVRGSKASRESWLKPESPRPKQRRRPGPDNPFAPAAKEGEFNPFAAPASESGPGFNPFAPQADADAGPVEDGVPRKLRLLGRGRVVFGSYAKLLLLTGEPSAYAQFGPLSAYPRAQYIRELYPALPSAPLPAVITCIATTSAARGQGLGQRLVGVVVEDLADRGFAAVETYPDLTLSADEASAASPAFWERCGFHMAAPDERYPVMRRELG